MIHRIFLAPIRPGLDAETAHRHWTSRHAGVFARTPRLLGYTQNRPLPEDWPTRTHVCAEVWFADRDGEAAAWGSEYYRTEVTDDESRFVDRDHAWVSRMTTVHAATVPHTYRVLALGHTPATAAAWVGQWDARDVDVFELRTPPPGGGASSLIALWTDDLTLARRASVGLGPDAFVARPVPVVVAPEAPWTAADALERR